MESLKGKVAIVTGSSGGIGKNIAACIAAQGASVVITSRNIDTAKKISAEIIKNGGKAMPCRFVLEEPDTGNELLKKVIKEYNQLDILVNNAVSHPTLPPIPLEKLSLAKLQDGIAANLTNVLALTSLSFSHLKSTKGSVLNIGSVAVNRNFISIPLYTIVKGALTQATKALAAEWAKDGVRVNQINPGYVNSDAYKNIGIPEEVVPILNKYYEKFHPIGRTGWPDDIGSMAAFMVSEKATWMTGSIVDIDGGYSIQGVPTPNLFRK